MNFEDFGPEIHGLVQRMFLQKQTMDDDIFNTLSELLRLAENVADNSLLGFAHYHLADSLYAFEVDYDQFRHHISQAVSYLITTDEDALLTRAYNYLSIDASNNGVFDVAYYHLMNALNTCESLNDMYLLGIVNNNIGQIYARMGNYKKALEYVHLGNEQQLKTSSDDVYYYQNTINGYFSEGILNIFLGNFDEAKDIEAKIRALEAEATNPELTNITIPVSFLRLQIALVEHDETQIKEQQARVMSVIGDAHRLFDFITDIRDLCMFLIEHEHFEIARAILDAISCTINDSNVPRMKQHLWTIEIAYFEKLGKQDELLEALLKQHHANLEQEEEQYRIHQTSIEVIDTMNDIRKQHRVYEMQARTDALTGVPNRLDMERNMNTAFDKAYISASQFAVEILDIDSFKEYNDFYGHQTGDVCLQKIANVIAHLAEEEDFFYARYGGDEFVLIYEGKSNEEIYRIAQKLEAQICDLNISHARAKKTNRVSVSQGICNDVPQPKIKPWDFFTKADKALYIVKSGYYSPGEYSSICLVDLSHKS